MTAKAVGSEGEMSSLYEQWKPAAGDRVRIVERNELGAPEARGRTGTVMAVHPEAPEALCEVQCDGRAGGSQTAASERFTVAELEPIEETAARLRDVPDRLQNEAFSDEGWRPTVGDRVTVRGSGREATITAIDARPSGTVCEVEFNHRPGEQAEPRRATYPLRDLVPTREPSSEALTG